MLKKKVEEIQEKQFDINDAEEWCYFMFKPGYTDSKTRFEVLDKLYDMGARVWRMKNMWLSSEACREHYAHIVDLKDKITGEAVYPKLENYMLSGPVTGVWLYGKKGLIEKVRKLMGSTKNPNEGTLRQVYTKRVAEYERITKNGFHASDSPENAKIEIKRFFERANELGIREGINIDLSN